MAALFNRYNPCMEVHTMSDATVLLAKGLDKDKAVVDVRGTPFFRKGATGVADSIQAVEEAAVVRAPAYWLAQGRIAAVRDARSRGNVKLALEEVVWSDWHNALGDTDVFATEKEYQGFKKGVFVADIVNGTVFSHDHQRIRDSVLNRNGLQLQNGAVRLTSQDADMLFGEGMVYGWKDGKMQPVKATLYRSGAEFLEASADPHFLDQDPVYAVIRPIEEAQHEPSGYQAVSAQLDNIGLAIRLGGKRMVRELLVDEEGKQHFGWSTFGSHHRDYAADIHSGRVVVVDAHSGGVGSLSLVSYFGRPVGVAPEALDARAKIVAPLPLEVTVDREAAVQEEKMIPEDHVRRLLRDHFGYTAEIVQQGLHVLHSYQAKK